MPRVSAALTQDMLWRLIREKFNTYRFADYKESMITLLAKVVRVSVEANEITDAMKALDRSEWEEGA